MSKLGIGIFSACVLVGLVPAVSAARSPDLYAAQHASSITPLPSAPAARVPEGEVTIGTVVFNPAPAKKPVAGPKTAPKPHVRKDCQWYPMWSSGDERVWICGM